MGTIKYILILIPKFLAFKTHFWDKKHMSRHVAIIPHANTGATFTEVISLEANTHHLFEQLLLQLRIQKTLDKLLSGCAGDGPELGVILTLLGNV